LELEVWSFSGVWCLGCELFIKGLTENNEQTAGWRKILSGFIQFSSMRCLFSGVNEGSKPVWCEQLYQAKAAELILYGRALGLTHCEAEDVVQETFLALLQRSGRPEKPEHYCVRTFRNRALNYRRSFFRRVAREFESSRWFERGPGETPAERAAMRCLAELPPEQREVIVLKIWHEFTYEEVGELLEISPNTAAGRYRYGLEKLRACLKGESYEREESVGNTVKILGSAPPVAGA
jgi:RNA polymerase sigma-70 factor (ECF subfamily)